MLDFEYLIKGEKGENIIFLNGFRMPYSNWDKVYPVISKNNRVFLYNRKGVGKSNKATLPQDANTVIKELKEELRRLNIQAPYIFVAHSLGGIFANLYARKYINEVKAIVFVESSHPDEIFEHKKIESSNIFTKTNNLVKSLEKIFDKYKYSEDEEIQTSIEQIKKAGKFPSIPIVVVSGLKKMPFIPKESFEIHLKYQKKLTNLSSKVLQYKCFKSAHFPQIEEPDIVINAIKEIIK